MKIKLTESEIKLAKAVKKSKIPKLLGVKLDPNCESNYTYPLLNYNFEDTYLVLGEATCKHYILMCLSTGEVKRGMLELHRFKLADEENDY